jgi:hypothetical protein
MITTVVTDTEVTPDNAVGISPLCWFQENQYLFKFSSFNMVRELVEYLAIKERYARPYSPPQTIPILKLPAQP